MSKCNNKLERKTYSLFTYC